jgi:hypothetical protein
MPPKIKIGNAVLCEHVVEGLGKKHTLVNTFAGDVLVPQFPATLFFGLYIEYYSEKDHGNLSIDILIDGKKFAEVTVSYTLATPGRPGIISIPIFEVGAPSEGVLEIVMREEGRRRTPVLKKQILLLGGPNDPSA